MTSGVLADWADNSVVGAAALGAAGLLAAAAAAARTYILKWGEVAARRMERREEEDSRQKHYEAFVRFAKFHQQLERVKAVANVERVLLFIGKDDGGLPDLTKPYTVICRYGWAQDERANPEESYSFNLVVDKTYCLMLAEMIRDGRVIQTTATMPPEAMLRKYYQIEKVVQAVIYLLNIDSAASEIMFVSFASYTREFTPEELAFIDVRVDRMRAIVSKAGDGSDLHPAIRR